MTNPAEPPASDERCPRCSTYLHHNGPGAESCFCPSEDVAEPAPKWADLYGIDPDFTLGDGDGGHILRRAADGLRGEYETDPFRLGQTMLALADWLDATADARANAIALGMGEPDRALAVARAYLGERP